jgi:hypothetical protein
MQQSAFSLKRYRKNRGGWLLQAVKGSPQPCHHPANRTLIYRPQPSTIDASSLWPTKQPRNRHDDALIVYKELPVVFLPLLVSLLPLSRDSRCHQQFSVSLLAVDLEMRL